MARPETCHVLTARDDNSAGANCRNAEPISIGGKDWFRSEEEIRLVHAGFGATTGSQKQVEETPASPF